MKFTSVVLALVLALPVIGCSDEDRLNSGTGASSGTGVPANTAAPPPGRESTAAEASPGEATPIFIPAPSSPVPGSAEAEPGAGPKGS